MIAAEYSYPYTELAEVLHGNSITVVLLYMYILLNPLAVGFFCYPPIGTEIILLYILTWHGVYFFIFTVCRSLFSLVLPFPGLRIEAMPLSKVQGKCICKMFKAENQETQLPLLCTKPSIDKHKLSSFQGWYSRGRFIGHSCLACTVNSADLSAILCHNSRIERADLPAIHAK